MNTYDEDARQRKGYRERPIIEVRRRSSNRATPHHRPKAAQRIARRALHRGPRCWRPRVAGIRGERVLEAVRRVEVSAERIHPA